MGRMQIDELVCQEARERLKNHPAKDMMGFCHIYWAEMKSIYNLNLADKVFP